MSFSRLAADLLKRNTTASPLDVGVMRCWVFGLLFVHYVHHDFAAFARLPTVLWRPPFWLRSLSMEFFEPSRVEALHVAWLVLLAFACIGLLVKISSLGALLVGVILLWFENTVAYANAKDVLIIWAMYALAVLSTPDQFSADRLLFRRRFEDASRGATLDKGEFFATYFVRAMLALMFCSAAMSKLRASGIHWGTNGTLANLFAAKALTGGSKPQSPRVGRGFRSTSDVVRRVGARDSSPRAVCPARPRLGMGAKARRSLTVRDARVVLVGAGYLFPDDFGVFRFLPAIQR